MIFNIPFVADLELLHSHRQQLIDERLRCAILKRHTFDYQPGQQVLLKIINPIKLGQQTTGPFQIHTAHTFGTFALQLRPHVFEGINIHLTSLAKQGVVSLGCLPDTTEELDTLIIGVREQASLHSKINKMT
jgi:hypothetical protein